MHLKDIIIIIVTAVYGIVLTIYPDFPLTMESCIAIVLYFLGRISVLSYKHRKISNGVYHQSRRK